MFSVSNMIAYDGMMVYGTPERKPLHFPESCWIDVPSKTADGNWIEDEGETVKALLRNLLSMGVSPDDIFMISPFRAVVRKLKELPRSMGDFKVGTIHTVQGKEANVVILVLGGGTTGAKDWAAQKPNLLNVAASRAKRRLYVIGERSSWRKRPYFDVLAKMLPVSTTNDYQ